VVPAYNAARTLGVCVSSALAQTVSDLEVVIVDDGSTDQTRMLASAISDPRVIVHSQANGGLPAARNAGIKRSRGAIVSFLDSDDLLSPRYLQEVAAVFDRDPELTFVYADAWTFDDATHRVRMQTTAQYQRPPQPPPPTAQALFRELVQRNFIIIPVAVRHGAIVAAGLFDEQLTSAEDWDMWLRLAAAGHRAWPAGGPLGLRREHLEQMSGDYRRMLDNQVRMFEKLVADPSLAAEDEALVQARLERARRALRALSGEDRGRALALAARRRLGRVRGRLGLGDRWYEHPPAIVTEDFGDLSKL
jgi:glycosyltransferase involved in cell wall biosynthesis